MNLDFGFINSVAATLHKAYLDDGGFDAYDRGKLVHRVEFDPQTGNATVQVQWPKFRNIVANNKADGPATYTISGESSVSGAWMHWTCYVQGVKVVAVMCKSDLLMDLEMYYEKAHKMYHQFDLRNLLALFQNKTGWNLNWNKEDYDG